jgi:hypothetical protein
MENDTAKELLDELLPHLEAMETQCAGILQLLKDKGLATDEELAPYLEQAGKASDVRWRAGRLRIERLLSSLTKDAQKVAEVPVTQPASQNGSDEKPATSPVEEKATAGRATAGEKKEDKGTDPDNAADGAPKPAAGKEGEAARASGERPSTEDDGGAGGGKKMREPDTKPEKDAA